ncbi:hypothetical protein C8K36_106218 [Rhodococcus sp. OK519]|uniref:hypothetical protein n=1 Tax=Rhodococcus sp. OK519 TaxID=2135729 RepID=UPI000D3490EC|nr:hypothetical protein C8K36_106218 [Rhodococcus sp. OK519]
MTTDLLETLEAMRPDSDALWPEDLRAAACARIIAADAEPTTPRARSRRAATVVTVAALVATAGVGAAAASGMMPQAFTDHFSHWRDALGPGTAPVDPAAAQRVGTVPGGPDGLVFSVLVAHGAGDQRCLASVFESPESATQPGPSEFTDLGSRCRQGPEGFGDLGDGAGYFPLAFGDGGGGEIGPNAVTFDAAAGQAVRAEIRTSTGQVLPMVLADGSFFGWFPMPATPSSPRPVLTGYADDGTVVGSFEIGPGF